VDAFSEDENRWIEETIRPLDDKVEKDDTDALSCESTITLPPFWG
jgi:hypothetical protein